jgi:hypothetical protein
MAAHSYAVARLRASEEDASQSRSVQGSEMRANKRIKYVRYAHPTRNGEAPLLAAHAER